MRRWSFSGLWMTALAAWLVGCGTPQPKRLPPPRNLATEVKIEFQQALLAWNQGNLDRFMAIYAEDATFALQDTFIQGRRAIRDYYAPLFQSGGMHGELNFELFDVEVLCLDMILVRGIYHNREPDGTILRGTTTLLFRHDLNHWRIIHDHTT